MTRRLTSIALCGIFLALALTITDALGMHNRRAPHHALRTSPRGARLTHQHATTTAVTPSTPLVSHRDSNHHPAIPTASFDVTAYGAVGDGVTDCTYALMRANEAALEFVRNNTQGSAFIEIYFPSGTYYFNASSIHDHRVALMTFPITVVGTVFQVRGENATIRWNSLSVPFISSTVPTNGNDVTTRLNVMNLVVQEWIDECIMIPPSSTRSFITWSSLHAHVYVTNVVYHGADGCTCEQCASVILINGVNGNLLALTNIVASSLSTFVSIVNSSPLALRLTNVVLNWITNGLIVKSSYATVAQVTNFVATNVDHGVRLAGMIDAIVKNSVFVTSLPPMPNTISVSIDSGVNATIDGCTFTDSSASNPEYVIGVRQYGVSSLTLTRTTFTGGSIGVEYASRDHASGNACLNLIGNTFTGQTNASAVTKTSLPTSQTQLVITAYKNVCTGSEAVFVFTCTHKQTCHVNENVGCMNTVKESDDEAISEKVILV